MMKTLIILLLMLTSIAGIKAEKNPTGEPINKIEVDSTYIRQDTTDLSYLKFNVNRYITPDEPLGELPSPN